MTHGTGYESLANAIVFVAVRDYQNTLADLWHHGQDQRAREVLDETERFFLSEWYQRLTGIDARRLMSRSRKQLRERGYKRERVRVCIDIFE